MTIHIRIIDDLGELYTARAETIEQAEEELGRIQRVIDQRLIEHNLLLV